MTARRTAPVNLEDPEQVERLRQRVTAVVEEAEGDALLLGEQVLVAMAEPLELPILLEAVAALLALAGRAAEESDHELMNLRRRLQRSLKPPTH